MDESQLFQYMGLLQEFAAKLVLEVFGAGGAIWGFSEVCGLRTKNMESIRFWRSAAITVAVLFGIRWLRQLREALLLLAFKPPAGIHRQISNPRTPEMARTEDTFLDMMQERSPFGIQLLSYFDGAEEDSDEEAALMSPAESCDESTALTSSSHSPKI